MENILFRGKRIDTNEWIYGDLIRECASVATDKLGFPKKDYDTGDYDTYTVPCIYNPELDDDGDISSGAFEVIKETISQYTNKNDKSKNKIFGGDIVTDGNRKWIIMWDDENGCWFGKDINQSRLIMIKLHYLNFCDTTIIGNKWDNLELLEEGV